MAYNLIDLAWVGRLGSESVAAVGAIDNVDDLMTTVNALVPDELVVE